MEKAQLLYLLCSQAVNLQLQSHLFPLFPIQSFSFPGFVPVSKSTPSIKDNIILQSEYFTCNG